MKEPDRVSTGAQSTPEPWHYDVFEGKPEWAVELSRIRVLQHQRLKLDRRRAQRGGHLLEVVD